MPWGESWLYSADKFKIGRYYLKFSFHDSEKWLKEGDELITAYLWHTARSSTRIVILLDTFIPPVKVEKSLALPIGVCGLGSEQVAKQLDI